MRLRALTLWFAAVLALGAGCVTQTTTSAPLWQPGSYRGAGSFPAARSPPKPGAQPGAQSPGEATAPAAGAAAAPPPTEDPEGQLRLLSPAEPEAFVASPPPISSAAEREAARAASITAPTPPRVRQFHAYAATYGAGRCRFRSCATHGWTTPHADGESETRCRADDCLQEGWTTTYPDGASAEIRCQAGGCLTAGWSTSSSTPGLPATTTRCLPGGCLTAGWSTSSASPQAAQTRCQKDDCQKAGWQTRLPSGDTVECTCILKDCVHNGAECR